MIRYDLPTTDDLVRLGEPHAHAVTIYVPTSPTPAGRAQSATALKSAVDDAIRQLRAAGADADVQEAVRLHGEVLSADTHLWGNLSGSLAVFVSPELAEDWVLPNDLEPQTQVGDWFDIGQLVRAVTTPQEAFALTLSGNGWNLWRASATARAAELDLGEAYAEDAADATNRMTIRGRGHERRLVGDEGRKVLLERYARTVADAVRTELGRLDPNAARPLFVFATEPLLSMIQAENLAWPVVAVPGAPDELRPDQVDEAIRARIGEITSKRLSGRAEQIGNGFASGLAATDLAQIAKAACAGAVGTLIYDFTVDVLGTLDESTGELRYAEDGYDLLSRIAVLVLRFGGEAIAVRPDEVWADIWDGRALAQLRHPLV
ncbi:MAG: hypothetical protein QM779_15010 [Propionicimonas sp.]|uniref:baeRF11 domain-containing protein n=1 Tax=Propionicimonas sp. TaxID=1955623 RepID=UPI003D0AC8E4